MRNHLKNETSPYLLQHAENPVEWYPWCDAAFQKAQAENKPVFLSIGYSTCHWCHVMARESFEDRRTAEILNRYFVCVKVDREERPDIDSVYMSVCQAFTGSGGWPLSIFMTWDKKPFFAGTYFPARAQYGMPGFSDLLQTIAEQWACHPTSLLKSSEEIIAQLKQAAAVQSEGASDPTGRATAFFEQSFDPVWGGFGTAPKFPTPHHLLFLMLCGGSNGLEMAEKTLIQLRKGGIFDQIGYGFSRYSTDRYFLAPHFEKMLYDNALLMMAYAAAYSLTDNRLYLDTAEKTAAYILREMTADEGGFYSAQDADSDGVEGKYYTFTRQEIIEVLGAEAGSPFADAFDITEQGNFEGVNIPNLLQSNELAADFTAEIKRLYAYRKGRARLHLDDKILTAWNAMMIAALSMLYRTSRHEKYLLAAQRAQLFLEKNLCAGSRLYTGFRNSVRTPNSVLDDYAYYIAALTELYRATLDIRYLEKAQFFCNEAVNRFADRENAGFYLCPADSSELFLNPKETYDGAIPSGNSVMAFNLVRLYQLTEKDVYEALAKKQIAFMTARAQDDPAGHTLFLIAKHLFENPPAHLTIVPRQPSDIKEIRLPFLANVILAPESKEHPLLNGRTTYYLCKDRRCLPPTNTMP